MAKLVQIFSYVKHLNVKINTHYRGNCPSCGGVNTFSVSNASGVLKYYCFKASCQIKGQVKRDMTVEEAINYLKKSFVPPQHGLKIENLVGWKPATQSLTALKYLNKNNCIEALRAFPAKFWYDKINDRVCFVEYENVNSFRLATGRTQKNQKPKWYKYISMRGAFFTIPCLRQDECSTIAITEDAASACSIARVYSALSLSGTSYDTSALLEILESKKVKDVLICLDKDAQNIGMKLRRDLSGAGKFRVVKLLFLTDDAKYLSEDKLKRELEYEEGRKV